MRDPWRSAQGMKNAATLLLALALAGIAVMYTANQKAIRIQGPGAMQAVDARTLWVGVNEELWVVDVDGHRTRRVTTGELGLRAAVSNIVPAPGEQALLTSRRDTDWQLVDRATLARVRAIAPQWPPGFTEHHSGALHFAVAPNGDIAVATGGGHTVLLFAADGKFKARTPTGTYHFTNGLWWSPEGWWTTDTNRFALHLLDAEAMTVKRTVQLAPLPAGYPYLAEFIPSQGQPRTDTGVAPLATLTRVGYLMEPGHAVDVFPDGSQVIFNPSPFGQLRDLTWFDGQLLLVDGASYTLQRFGADRTAQEPFGDAQLRAELRRMRADRDFWGNFGSRYAFLATALLLLAGIAAYARHRRLLALGVVATRVGGRAAAQAAPLKDLARQRLWIYGLPIAIRLLVVFLGALVLFPWLHTMLAGTPPGGLAQSARLLVLSVFGPLLPVAFWQQWRHEKLASDPRYEPALNHRAIEWLAAHDDFDRIKLEGEVPRETVYLPGWRARWLLVTNRRVLLFAASARERFLVSEWPRRSVLFAGAPQDLPGAAPRPLWRRLLWPDANLAVTFGTGSTLHLRCASAVTARRAGQLLMAGGGPVDTYMVAPAGGVVATGARRRWHEVLASFVVPGAGQWLQGRFTTGVVLFTAAALLCTYDWGPVLWALKGSKMDVSAVSIFWAAVTWLVLSLVASNDAYHFSARRKARRR